MIFGCVDVPGSFWLFNLLVNSNFAVVSFSVSWKYQEPCTPCDKSCAFWSACFITESQRFNVVVWFLFLYLVFIVISICLMFCPWLSHDVLPQLRLYVLMDWRANFSPPTSVVSQYVYLIMSKKYAHLLCYKKGIRDTRNLWFLYISGKLVIAGTSPFCALAQRSLAGLDREDDLKLEAIQIQADQTWLIFRGSESRQEQ